MWWCRIIVAGLFGLLMAGAASAGEPTECDRLAGSPTDPNRVGAGIGLYGIEPGEAIAACERALAVDPHNPRLHFNLGRAHAARYLVDKRPDEKALIAQSFKAAADQVYPAAQVELAAFYWFGWGGFQQDTGEAMRLLEKAMVSDAKEAKLQHRHLFDETVLAGDLDDAQIQYIKKAADASDADALYSLGLRLFFGGDKAERALLLHKAAVLGSAPAALDLAQMYFRGSNGLGKSPQESVRLFQQAMAGDDPFTRHLIATLYEQGYQGLPKDEKQAAQLNKQASDEGNAFAQYALGRFYEEGKGGLPQDAREAARLYKLAADQGNGDATVALARYMADGRGGYEADKAKAVEYLKRAARWSTQAKDELTKMGG